MLISLGIVVVVDLAQNGRLHADLAWDRGGGRPRSKRSRLPAAVEEDAAVRIAGLGFEFAGMESL